MQRVNMRAIAAATANRLVRFASFPPMAGLPSVSPAPLDIATEDPTIAARVDVLEEVRRYLDGVWVVSGVCTTRIISNCGIVVNCQLVFDSKRPVVLTGAGVSTGAADSTSLLRVHCVQALQWVHILLPRVLGGVGCLAESGIPDYRSPGRPEYRPLQHREFIEFESTRRRYWARSAVGYRRVARARPGITHKLLAALEFEGRVSGLITQNVDRLHQRAGSNRVLELHGTIHDVECLDCDIRFPRDSFQRRLEDLNGRWMRDFQELAATHTRPDGDVELPSHVYDRFQLPKCGRSGCRGALKPCVVFHGGHIEPSVTDRAQTMVDRATSLLVLGSSMTVFSSYRLARRAADKGIPVGIVTFGDTRADSVASVKLEANVSPVLKELTRRRGGEWSRGVLRSLERGQGDLWTPPMPGPDSMNVQSVPPAEGTLGPDAEQQ